MKTLRVMIATLSMSVIALAADNNVIIAKHMQTAQVDVHLEISKVQAPRIPGAPGDTYRAAVSILPLDPAADVFGVVLSVRLADGSFLGSMSKFVTKDPFGGPVVVTFDLGDTPPVGIREFYVVRYHAEPADLLVVNGEDR